MNQQDEQRQAADALAMVERHQESTRRATRVPWWVYLVMFLLTAGGVAVNDFVTLTGAKVMAGVVMVLAIVVIGTRMTTRSSPIDRLRRAAPRQEFVPSAFFVVAVLGGAGAWLLTHYDTAISTHLAGAVGLHNYPNTVLGIVYGIAFTALFALGRFLVERRRNAR